MTNTKAIVLLAALSFAIGCSSKDAININNDNVISSGSTNEILVFGHVSYEEIHKNIPAVNKKIGAFLIGMKVKNVQIRLLPHPFGVEVQVKPHDGLERLTPAEREKIISWIADSVLQP